MCAALGHRGGHAPFPPSRQSRLGPTRPRGSLRSLRELATSIPALCLLVACGGNPYGYAPEYVPLSEEEPYNEKGLELSYEEVRRDPLGHQNKLLAWFGVVTDVQKVGDSGQVRVAMTLRFHQDRHLCSDQFDSSCRVTISDKEGGPFSALLTLRPDEREGKDRVYGGSLLKVYGHATTEYDDRGGPILKVDYHRHWPLGTYVNTRRSHNMRR